MFIRNGIMIKLEQFICMSELRNTIWSEVRVDVTVSRHHVLSVGCQSGNFE